MDYENLLYEKKDRVGVVTMNRPEYLNALAPGMSRDLAAVFEEMADDPEVRATVLTGAGRGFCAGAFVRDPNTHSLTHASDRLNRRQEEGGFKWIWNYPKPVVGAINGPAYGAGLNIVLACDMIIASTAARFCFPMSRLGIIPATPGAPGLALYVGKAKAAEMAIMSRPVDGEDAYRWGLANKVVPPEQLMDEAFSWALEIANGVAPLSAILIKEDLRESWASHLQTSANRLRFMTTQLTADREEGHRAWREKRTPVFTGR